MAVDKQERRQLKVFDDQRISEMGNVGNTTGLISPICSSPNAGCSGQSIQGGLIWFSKFNMVDQGQPFKTDQRSRCSSQ